MVMEQNGTIPFADNAYDWLEKSWGKNLSHKTSQPTATTTSAKLVDRLPRRVSLTIINLGSNNIYIAPEEAASTTNGIYLTGSGGSFAINLRKDAVLPLLEWSVISETSTSAVYVLEVRMI